MMVRVGIATDVRVQDQKDAFKLLITIGTISIFWLLIPHPFAAGNHSVFSRSHITNC